MKTIKQFLIAVGNLFRRPETKAALLTLVDYVPLALPYIRAGAQIIAGITPTGIDDMAIGYITFNYPQLFDGSIKNAENLKLFVFSAMADAMRLKFNSLSTTQARAVVQIAFAAQKAEGG